MAAAPVGGTVDACEVVVCAGAAVGVVATVCVLVVVGVVVAVVVAVGVAAVVAVGAAVAAEVFAVAVALVGVVVAVVVVAAGGGGGAPGAGGSVEVPGPVTSAPFLAGRRTNAAASGEWRLPSARPCSRSGLPAR
jgi:hypothetical protein